MGNLLTSLFNTANAFQVYNQAMQVTQNNVLNSNTPGYAKQIQSLEALPFDVSVGLPGGVAAGPVLSSRNAFAEQAVRQQQSQLGTYQQMAADLGQLESSFDVSNASGIGPAVNGLFNSFSQLSINPNDTVSRQAVITTAQQAATAVQRTANGLLTTGQAVDQETTAAVDHINDLARQIASLNAQHSASFTGSSDAGLDATLNSDLEELSQYADFNALQQPDGSVTIYLGGQMPLVVADQTLPIQVDASPSGTVIRGSNGVDITNTIHGGQLSGLLQTKNQLLPSYMTDLNTLASSLADQVNTTLAGGVDQNNQTPTTDLFTYDPVLGAARTLAVNPLTPDQIAAALPNAPGGNGNALNLAALASAKSTNGYTFSDFYGNLAGRVGQDLAAAKDNTTSQQSLVTQAQSLRQSISGVSLDEEATHLIAFQRSYQATAKMMTVINGLLDTVMGILPATA